MTKPLRKKRSRKEKPEAFRRVAADADGSANESIGYDSSADVDPNRQDGQIGEPISGPVMKKPYKSIGRQCCISTDKTMWFLHPSDRLISAVQVPDMACSV